MPADLAFARNPDALIRDLRSLLRDLGEVREGTGPTPAELAAAPLLEDWSLRLLPQSALRGRLVQACHYPGGPAATAREHDILEQPLWVWHGDAGWARLERGYVRLGRAALDQR